ncbi:MAG: DUF4870 domain-containing protein [Solirubrobacteraceae bacterium]
MASPPGSAGPRRAGWYPDPEGSSWRYWDGARWTGARSSAIPPAGPNLERDDQRSWALAAHLSALLSILAIGLSFIGPLVAYLANRDKPFVRDHAREALNFNLSFLICLAALLLLVIVAELPLTWLLVGSVVGWLALICVAAVKAGQGEEYRYPVSIRFVR